MTRIDFYIIDQGETLVRERFSCRLARKAFRLGQRLHIHAGGQPEVAQLDELLWTFSDISFLPHAPLGSDEDAPITVGCSGSPDPAPELLINLAEDIPAFFSRFARLAEIVGTDEKSRALGREHFRFYRDRGYPLQVHNL